jgi:hypothetical protein
MRELDRGYCAGFDRPELGRRRRVVGVVHRGRAFWNAVDDEDERRNRLTRKI